MYGKKPIPSGFVEIDRQAEETMRRSKLTQVGIPGLSTGDGNCLFNSVSTVLTGDEDLAPELRLRTAVEMSQNPERYRKRTDYNDLLSCSPTYEESTLAACTDGAYMSVWNMMALSTVVGNPIQSFYPALNGEKDKTPGFLNKRFQTEENRNRDTIKLLWSRLGPYKRPTWTPNHFVPILSRNSLPQAATETNFPPPHAKLSQANNSTPKHVPTKQQTSTVDDQKPVTKPPQNLTIVPVNSPKQVATDLPTATVIGNDGT